MSPPSTYTRRRKRHRSRGFPIWPFAILILMASVGGLVWSALARLSRPKIHIVEGYITDDTAIEREYSRLYNRPLADPQPRQEFHYAAQLAARGDYVGASSALERIVREASVPAVFNDLGVLYASRNDAARAMNAFRESMARDGDYQPTRDNLKRLQPRLRGAPPVTQEIEPNDIYLLANPVAAGKAVDAEISALRDTDCYRFQTAPGAERAVVVQIENLSKTLMPSVSVFDANDRFLGWSQDTQTPGQPLTLRFTPKPDTVLILHVFGYMSSLGNYRLSIK